MFEELIPLLNGTPFAVQFEILDAMLFVCKKQKKEFFDSVYLKNFCPPQFDSLAFVPSVGNSGGSVIICKAQNFQGMLSSKMSMLSQWNLLQIYRPAPGLSQTFMLPVLRKENSISSIGCLIFLCRLTSFGSWLGTSI
jgi:hypothetical protein